MAADAWTEQARIVPAAFDETIALHTRVRGTIHAICELIERQW